MNTKAVFLFISSVFIACTNPKKESLREDPSAETKNTTKIEGDTTICERDCSSANLDNAISYFRENNKYKDWLANDKKDVLVRGIAEKDSTLNRISIKSCGNKDLDDEAIRLIKNAKISPALNNQGKPVRSQYVIIVHFPPQ